MSDTALESFTHDELVRLVRRNNFVKEQQAGRVTALLMENLEMLAIVQELQGELAEVRGRLELLTSIQNPTLEDVGVAGNGSEL